MATNLNTTNKLLAVIAILMFSYVKGEVIARGGDPERDMVNISKLLDTALKEVDYGD